jgi:hypothetical protein
MPSAKTVINSVGANYTSRTYSARIRCKSSASKRISLLKQVMFLTHIQYR